MRNSTIRVSAFDIKRGRKKSHTYNPIARAIWQRLRDQTLVQLVHNEILIAGHGRIWFKLPLRAIRFATRFDEEKPVAPISFSLPIPPHLLRRNSEGKRDLAGYPFYDSQV
jgi:hypothetical protein